MKDTCRSYRMYDRLSVYRNTLASILTFVGLLGDALERFIVLFHVDKLAGLSIPLYVFAVLRIKIKLRPVGDRSLSRTFPVFVAIVSSFKTNFYFRSERCNTDATR